MAENKYKEHFLMDVNTVKDFVKSELSFFEDGAELEASEIGDGNINYVFKVRDKKTGKSLVVKQADKLLRSSGRPLDLHRNKIEAEILKIEGELAKGFVPEIYGYNETMCALSMEDISEYKNLRKELMSGKTFGHFAENISEFLADTLIPTTDMVFDRHEKKEKVKLFTNVELCDISEDLVFTEPYYDYKGRNIITEGNEEFVRENLYSDEELRAEVGYLRNRFMNEAQALIHGDLHSGSIFINEKGLKVIDPEFAFYGPMGYDVGNVIGNLFFAWANKIYTEPENKAFLDWIEKAAEEIFDLVKDKFSKKLKELVSFPLYNEKFKERYLEKVMADSIGYAGTEIIRRTVGDSKVAELTSLEANEGKIRLERVLVTAGISFIKNRRNVKSGKELNEEFKKAVKSNGFS